MFDAIDVSKWQGAMNWATIKNAGVRHAMIRAGYGTVYRCKQDNCVYDAQALPSAWEEV